MSHTKQQKIDILMQYQTSMVNEAIAHGESPDCFDLSGARMYYEDLTLNELDICLSDLIDCN